ncbi:uncharacterized protein LOC129618282 [Condylostylus longicornis]|uniref:uncharacterized protein LOC129618282 n=1 Tax=Condylostylus longicornis TaxID=2530218 RepID=UPI00244DFA39|nr:uncharacterized protein LOC129618282 [Condylostylus longicornis]
MFCVVGGGPAGLASAIRLKQLAPELSVAVLEKSSEIGGHIVSGNIFDTRALDELLPEWRNQFGKTTPDQISAPFPFRAPKLRNNLGVVTIPGASAARVLLDEGNQVRGVRLRDEGINKQGLKSQRYERGMRVLSKQLILAEGCRGSLSEFIKQHFNLVQNSCPQRYALGLKEVWEINPSLHSPGAAIHTVGWPLNYNTFGGGFLYHHFSVDNKPLLHVGFVVGLDYKNPWIK